MSKEESPHEVLLQTTEGIIIRVDTPTMTLMLATVHSYATKATPYVLAQYYIMYYVLPWHGTARAIGYIAG